jgi:hypothetical protein
MTVKIICLSYHGKILEIDIDNNISVNTFNKDNLDNKYKFKLGDGELERECDFDYNDKFVTIYAFNKGKDNIINKHELPPPIDNNTYYGDIFALFHENEKLIDFTSEEYKLFYENAFGGFEDLDTDETDNDEDKDQDDDDSDLDGFIVNDSEADASDYHTSEDDTEESEDDEDDTDELLEQYDVYKHYVDSMRKSGKSATRTIQDKLKVLYDELKKRNLL